ncbi:hypothetical protein SBV1_3230003 [Verrucomicrobia bacterium]|nr:hypothetical protein SBV1_3230003 [Verrucomicrobiota bacterium]
MAAFAQPEVYEFALAIPALLLPALALKAAQFNTRWNRTNRGVRAVSTGTVSQANTCLR